LQDRPLPLNNRDTYSPDPSAKRSLNPIKDGIAIGSSHETNEQPYFALWPSIRDSVSGRAAAGRVRSGTHATKGSIDSQSQCGRGWYDPRASIRGAAFELHERAGKANLYRSGFTSAYFESYRIISEVREAVDRNFYQPRLERAIAIYPVNIAEQKIAAVRTDVVTPRDGVSARNRERVLINLHGGGFAVGAGSGGLAESVPIAGLGKFKVVTVDYRMAPEYKFPAASEDVAMVYKELLRHYKAQNIGIYGCSAGGLLTAETVAWLQKEKLPRPGAIGIFCAGADAAFGGDSRFISGPLDVSLGLVSPPPAAPNPALMLMGYFSNADLKDPEVSPVVSPALLSNFPPTLLITGTRDLALSSAAYTQMQLVSGGVEADLHVWEGMGHNFIVDMDTPEAKEAYAVIVKFFDKHLGCNSRLIAVKAHLQSGCS
jgi:epsilon-lactone hydrolase